MPKYQLTERQKNILRAASKGLLEGTVKTEWTWQTMQSDTNRFELDLEITYGFPAAEKLGLCMQDLRDIERLGFLCAIAGRKAYHVVEQVIHDAVDNDFDMPDHTVPSTTLETNIHGNVIGSNISIAQHMDNVSQTVQSGEFLSLDEKADILKKVAELQQELNQYQETNSWEIREVTKSLDLVMGDLADIEPDRPNVTGSLERFKRAAEKLIFAPLAMRIVNEIVDLVVTRLSLH